MSITVIATCLIHAYKPETNATQAARKICTVFGEDTVSQHTTQKWFRKFASGDEILGDVPHK
jgi:hypothetical protein